MADSTTERKSRITRATIGRIAAVGFFVVLGTFAVMQSLRGKTGDEAPHEHSADDGHGHEHTDAELAASNSAAAGNGESSAAPAGSMAALAAKVNVPVKDSKSDPEIKQPAPKSFGANLVGSSDFAPPIQKVSGTATLQEPPSANQFKPESRSFEIARDNLPPALNIPKPGRDHLGAKATESVDGSYQSSENALPPIRPNGSFALTQESGTNIAPPLTQRPNTDSSPPAGNMTIGDSTPPRSNSFSAIPPRVLSNDKKPAETDDSGFGSGNKLLPPIRNASTLLGKAEDKKPDDNFPEFDRDQARQSGNPSPRPALNSQPFRNTETNPAADVRPRENGNLDRVQRPNQETTPNFPDSRQAFPAKQSGDPLPTVRNATNRSANILSGENRSLATPGARELHGAQTPSVMVQKIAPREVQVNKPANFELAISNVGKATAEDVVVYDRIPQGTTLIEADPEPKQGADGSLSWTLGSLAPGDTQKIRLKLLPTTPGEIGSVAQVTFSAKASSQTICTQPELLIKHRTAEKVLLGSDVILDIDVENKGDGIATNVKIQEDVPSQLDFPQGVREIEYPIGNLAPGEKRNVKLRLKAAQVGHVRNVLVAHGDGKLKAQHAVELEIVSPKIEVAGNGPTRKYLNRKATHEFSVRNSGTAAATNVELIAKLPRGLKFVETNNQGQYDSRSHAVYWSLQELEQDLSGTVQVTTLPIEPGDHSINFEATADLNQSANTARSLNVEHLVELFCEIDDLTDPVEIGGETAYQIKVVNQGLKAANNIRLEVTMPDGMEMTTINGTLQHQVQGGKIVFSPITRLDPKQEIALTVRAKGTREGDHRVVVSMQSDDRQTPISKEESTQVYSDR